MTVVGGHGNIAFVLEGYETFRISLGGHEMTPNIGPGPAWTSINDTSLRKLLLLAASFFNPPNERGVLHTNP